MRPFARSLRMTAIMAAVALAVIVGRMLWVNGLFSSVTPGFSGTCKAAGALPGVEDIEIAGDMAFISAAGARGPDGRDGIYALPLKGDGKLAKLAGTPSDFHPRGIGLYHAPGGGLYLFAVNRQAATGRFSIDSFEVTNAQTAPALAAQGTIQGGLLINPQDVAPSGPGTFYVANGTASRNALVHRLQTYGVIPGGDILYFNGMSFRAVADGLYGARSLVFAPGGAHLVVASLLTRSLRSFSVEPFTGNLTEGDSLIVPAAPEKLSLDRFGEIWMAGHANLFQWRASAADPGRRASSQVFRVSLSGGAPQQAEQVYGNAGAEMSGASVAASTGDRLLIGSSLDGRLLDCAQK